MENKVNYLKMGTRLKELRTEMGLSHKKLAARLEEQMGVRISRDSLMNYEGKPDKCPGMRIEYIFALSALYGVSTDYILGISDHESISEDAQTATNYVGLSEDVVSTLLVGVDTLRNGEIKVRLIGEKEE